MINNPSIIDESMYNESEKTKTDNEIYTQEQNEHIYIR